MRRHILLVLALAVSAVSHAQVADSTYLKQPLRSDFKYTQLIAPGTLMATGALVHFAFHDAIDVGFNKETSKWIGEGKRQKADDYLRFLPTVMHLGYEYIGAEPQHGILDRAIETAWAYASLAALGYGMKAIVDSPRPNGIDNRSFPSGHACVSFAGAELVRMEYGWGVGASAYAVAMGVSVLRLYNNDHWISDLAFGAGIGVLSAHVGGWLLEPTKKLLGIEKTSAAVTASVDPISGAVCPTLAFRF